MYILFAIEFKHFHANPKVVFCQENSEISRAELLVILPIFARDCFREVQIFLEYQQTCAGDSVKRSGHAWRSRTNVQSSLYKSQSLWDKCVSASVPA